MHVFWRIDVHCRTFCYNVHGLKEKITYVYCTDGGHNKTIYVYCTDEAVGHNKTRCVLHR